MEIAGTLLDKKGNTIDTFETTINLGRPTNDPDIPIRVNADTIKYVYSVSFTTIKAYTTESLI